MAYGRVRKKSNGGVRGTSRMERENIRKKEERGKQNLNI